MRTLLALLALALAEVFPRVALADAPPPASDTPSAETPRSDTPRSDGPGAETPRADTPHASLGSHGGDLSGRFGYESSGYLSPSVTLELRAAAGHDEALLGPLASFYRTQPEVLFGVRPLPQLSVFAGGGIGAAYVVPEPGAIGIGAGPTLTFSGALGARFPWERVPVTAVLRAQSVNGGGSAVTFDVALALTESR